MTKAGKVIKKQVNVGSKSEHEAVVLATSDGDYVLRRRDGNAYADTVWASLVGSRIIATGDIHAATFIVDSWEHDVAHKHCC